MSELVRLAILEDEALYLSLLRTLLSSATALEVVADASTAEAAKGIDPRIVDVALVDVGLGGRRTGIDIALDWTKENPKLAVVLLTSHANPRLLNRVPEDQRRNWSYLLKSSVSDIHALVYAIRSAAAGHNIVDPYVTQGRAMRPGSVLEQLSVQQLKVVRAVAAGASNAQIASDMCLSVKGVESLLRRTLPLLGVDTANRSINPRVAATLAVLTGLVPDVEWVADHPIGDPTVDS